MTVSIFISSGAITVSLRVVIDEVDARVTVIQLVNYILYAQHGRRIAIRLNEFGDELGIEKAMVNNGEGGALVQEWVELGNGCVCCSVKHSFVQALEQLLVVSTNSLESFIVELQMCNLQRLLANINLVVIDLFLGSWTIA